ncbi:hypothetical protein ABMA27_004784 [Loxostege sticticalis]|uniref:Integrase zinc-binding domain-containing protein n=1 Tax=Loxostege sticticalis TaxID=481309 RepID=A0ABR3HKN2_LOXSC
MENISECLCLFCSEQGHKVFSCEKFKKLSVEDRMKEIVKLRLCTNCLCEGHKSFNCRLKISCRVCKKKHNSLLHISKKANKTGSHAASESASGSTIPISPSVTLPTVSVGQVLLSTAMVNIVNSDNGQTYPARALLDTGSQSSFITESLKKNIMLSSDKDCTKPLKIVGINNVALNIKESCTIHMKSRCCPFERKVNCLVVPQITGTLPSAPVNVSSLNLPKNLVLADPNFHNPSDIDILLGADVYWEIVGCQRLSLGIGRPVLQESELGWIISGPTGESGNLHSKKPGHLSCNFTKQIHDNLQRFWEVEELHTNDLTFSPEEKLCENHFVNNHKRLLNGRFSVKIPFKEVPEDALGDSFYMARKRLLNLEKKFQINPKLKQSYSEFIEEYLVLGWIKAQPKLLKTFVANRVIEINELTQGFSWRHVPGDLNPADLASRGVDPQRLLSESLWWEGPPFLRKDLVEWPQQLQNMSIDLPELKTYVHVGTVETYKNPVIDFDRYSNFSRLRRIFAYVLRFINNCKGKNKITGCLNIEELDMSLKSLIKISQAEMFHEELKLLSESKQVNKRSNLLPLNPFIDSDGIIRVGGRLKNSLFDFNKKHPIILSAKHRFTKLLMSYEHNRLFHVGPQQLLSSIREVYWPIGGRTLARAVVKKCVICARYRGSVVKPIMGNLPSFRTESLFPFYSTGTDFAGPFYISSRQGRGNRITKCYLCIFICLSTRAVHLEVVSDLNTQAFIACLRRFVSRRGKPKLICCDNGTNFVGANNELGKVLRSSHKSVNEFVNSEGLISVIGTIHQFTK